MVLHIAPLTGAQ